jgi:glycosyltransferase involved in cell wall biosynthesis
VTPTVSALLVTTHPVAPPWDSADKHIAAALIRHAAGPSLANFGRAARPTPLAGARRLPMLSRRGKPQAPELLQAAVLGTAIQPAFDLVHAVVSVGPGFRRLVQAWRALPRRLRPPLVHTVPGVADLAGFAVRDDRTQVVALSQRTADLLRQAGAADVAVIEAGIDTVLWPLLEPPDTGRTTVLFAGHCDADGGLDTAIDGVARAAREDGDVDLLLALRHRPGRSASREQAAARGRAIAAGIPRVEVHGENAPMRELVRRASVVVLPGKRLHGKADVPFVVLESLSSGRPVILGDLPEYDGLGDVVDRIPAGSAEALGAAVLESARAPSRRREAARRVVEQRYSERAMAGRYVELYGQVLERWGRERPRGGDPDTARRRT